MHLFQEEIGEALINLNNTQGLPNESLHFGPQNDTCRHCGAYCWSAERNTQNSFAALCCNNGKVKLNDIPDPPLYLQKLFEEPTPEGRVFFYYFFFLKKKESFRTFFFKFFRKNIRRINSLLGMASIGCNEVKWKDKGVPTFVVNDCVHHFIGSYLPPENKDAIFSQLYIYDGESGSNRFFFFSFFF